MKVGSPHQEAGAMAATSPGANDAAYRTMGSQGGIHKPLKKNTVLREYYEVDKA